MPGIKTTKDYEQFNHMLSNRVINEKHLSNLIKSIQAKNLLKYSPIIVNERMQVIDGQHRLLAAETLHLDISYIEAPGLTIKDVQLLNSNVHPWSIGDYIQSYVNQGNAQYEYLVEFVEKHGLSFSMGAAMLSISEDSRRFGASYKEIRQGEFVVKDMDLSEEFVQAYKAVFPYTEENTFKDRDFARAFYIVFRHEEITMEDFMDRIQTYDKPLFRRAGVREYLGQFESVYNRGRGDKVRLY